MVSVPFLGRLMPAVLVLLPVWRALVPVQVQAINFTHPIQNINFVARHGGTCNVAGPGVWADGPWAWFPITNEVTPCPAGATDCLQKVTIDTNAYPNALCNDGSPAVMYVRINPVSSHWLIHLQAGGDCNSYDSCYQRWCGRDAYSASKMSTWHTPEAMAATGILKDDPSNMFRTWNVVYGYYAAHPTDPQRCSSPGHVTLFHVTTPMFLRQGLLEKLGDDNDDGVPDVDVELWKDATRDLLHTYGDTAYTDPVTGEIRESLTMAPGVFGADCSTHVAIENARFFDEEVVLNDGTQHNYATVLSNWVLNSGRRKAIQHDMVLILDATGYMHRSVCAPRYEVLPVCY